MIKNVLAIVPEQSLVWSSIKVIKSSELEHKIGAIKLLDDDLVETQSLSSLNCLSLKDYDYRYQISTGSHVVRGECLKTKEDKLNYVSECTSYMKFLKNNFFGAGPNKVDAIFVLIPHMVPEHGATSEFDESKIKENIQEIISFYKFSACLDMLCDDKQVQLFMVAGSRLSDDECFSHGLERGQELGEEGEKLGKELTQLSFSLKTLIEGMQATGSFAQTLSVSLLAKAIKETSINHLRQKLSAGN